MIAALIALVGAVLLAVGYFADITALGWVALAASVAAVVLLFLPKRAPAVESFETVAAQPPQEPLVETLAPEREPAPRLAKLDDRELGAVAVATELVLVIPGRRRYHRQGCALLGDHQVEQLTEEEAQEEEFTACTRCVK